MAVTKGALRTVFIDASGPPAAVAERTRASFRYNAALDLDEGVYELLRGVRSAKDLVRSARSELVARLSAYANDATTRIELEAVSHLIQKEMMHIIARQALSGEAIIRSKSALLASPTAINMTLDILTERGFTVVLDVQKTVVPSHVDSAGKVVSVTTRVYVFHVKWQKPEVRPTNK